MGRLARSICRRSGLAKTPCRSSSRTRLGRASRAGSRRSLPERRSTSPNAGPRSTRRFARRATLRSSSTAATSFPTSARRSRRMRTLSAQIRGGLRVGATGRPIRAVVNLGIGGSDLGALLVCSALAQPPRARGSTGPQTQGVDVSFVSNVDPEHLTRALAPLEPATTMFVITSKSFATQETLANAASAKSVARRGARQGCRRQLALHGDDREHAGREVVRHRFRRHPSAVGLGGRALLPVVACGTAHCAQDRLGALREAPGRRGERRCAFPRRRRSSATCPCCWGS